MLLETVLEAFPKELPLKGGSLCLVRPLQASDELDLHRFFLDVPESERLFIKHRVVDLGVIRDWCQNIDYGHNLPLLGWIGANLAGVATLHQQLGGWKRHIGRVSVLVHPSFRKRGLGRLLVTQSIELARQLGLEKIEAEFLGEQKEAIKLFGLLGFDPLIRLPAYVKDMQADSHDYVLLGMNLETDEEYASAG